MNLIKEMTTKEILDYADRQSQWGYCLTEYFDELRRRLCSPKQPYTIQYKWSACDVDIEKSPAFTVWGTSPIDAAQTLVDANNWRGQDMEFLVCLKGSDNSTGFTSKELE
jgi:hypothetical protein